jgi:hypothetical protein
MGNPQAKEARRARVLERERAAAAARHHAAVEADKRSEQRRLLDWCGGAAGLRDLARAHGLSITDDTGSKWPLGYLLGALLDLGVRAPKEPS